MSDGKLPPVLHHCRCVHHYRRQKAATGGKLPATKGVILRQVRCRLLSLFVAPVLPRFFHNDFVRGWCLTKINGFQISESRQKLRLAERIKSLDDGRSERPFLKSERA
jgi:hypothetical protein